MPLGANSTLSTLVGRQMWAVQPCGGTGKGRYGLRYDNLESLSLHMQTFLNRASLFGNGVLHMPTGWPVRPHGMKYAGGLGVLSSEWRSAIYEHVQRWKQTNPVGRLAVYVGGSPIRYHNSNPDMLPIEFDGSSEHQGVFQECVEHAVQLGFDEVIFDSSSRELVRMHFSEFAYIVRHGLGVRVSYEAIPADVFDSYGTYSGRMIATTPVVMSRSLLGKRVPTRLSLCWWLSDHFDMGGMNTEQVVAQAISDGWEIGSMKQQFDAVVTNAVRTYADANDTETAVELGGSSGQPVLG